MDKRCFWGLDISSIQNRSNISGFVPPWRQLILYRLLGYLSIHPHQFESTVRKQKQMKPISLHHLTGQMKKVIYILLRQWEFFQHDFHHNNLTKNTYTTSFLF